MFDCVFRSVVEVMDNDTLLVILGDHGMTRTGDHGGDSEAEINAALIFHTKREAVWRAKQVTLSMVQKAVSPHILFITELWFDTTQFYFSYG